MIWRRAGVRVLHGNCDSHMYSEIGGGVYVPWEYIWESHPYGDVSV